MIKVLIFLGVAGAIIWLGAFVGNWMVNDSLIWLLGWIQDVSKYCKFRCNTEHEVLLKDCRRVRHCDIPVISFDQFHDMYLLAPDKYTRDKDWRDKPLLYMEYHATANKYEYPNAVFTFSFFDWKRYFKWLKAKEKAEAINYEREQKIKSTQDATDSLRIMLEDVQRDIDKCRKQADKEKQEAADAFVEVARRIKERGSARSSGDPPSSEALLTTSPQVPTQEYIHRLPRMDINGTLVYIDDANQHAYFHL